VEPSDRGWKGVGVGVASSGAVTRKRAVGEAVVGLTGGAVQPAKIINISSTVWKVLLMDFLERGGIFSGGYLLQAGIIGSRKVNFPAKGKYDKVWQKAITMGGSPRSGIKE
jgi:hypothetical protein